MTISAWYMDEDPSDQRLPHKTDPLEPVSGEELINLGVVFWEGLQGEDDPKLAQIREERNYNYSDVIQCCPDKLPGYEQKILSFFEEHIHRDEEIRYCVEGSGYFDVRDGNDRWIRVALQGGDMIIIPAGLMHRFTNDEANYIKAMRLFQGEPIWTPYNRTDIAEDDADVVKYKETFLTKNKKARVETEVSA
mmetsp:Transcript_64574/g.139694  ORF Transcript_64574/g.139694 Transcript_64574/m.139694 type:complete len:192 (+) Transcript_64574:28-603(+)